MAGIEHFSACATTAGPGIVFSAHLGNWELPAVCAARFGLDATAIFRPPNDPAAARLVQEVRPDHGRLTASAGAGAAFAIAGVLERGGHLGQLIDQHFTRGFRALLRAGRRSRTRSSPSSPAITIARSTASRVVRLPGHRFRLELTPPLDLPRDAAGPIDVAGACRP